MYEKAPGLEEAPYDAQLNARNASLFGVADYYSRGFIALGHEAWEVHANNGPLQSAWMAAQGLAIPKLPAPPARRAGYIRRFARRARDRIFRRGGRSSSFLTSGDLDLSSILLTQIERLKPDVILNHAVSEVGTGLLEKIRGGVKLIVGQIASPLPDHIDYGVYDLMVSSLPNYVEYYRRKGVKAELNRLGFSPTVLQEIGEHPRDIPVSFVGSLTSDHASRLDLIEHLARKIDISIWGRVSGVPATSPIWSRYRGETWGRDMYEILARSKITINQHIDIAESYANNMRLYEATGMGALLITDWKANIADIFEPGKEVVCYRNAQECVDLVEYYLAHDDERARIAKAGQQRSETEHRYSNRTRELSALFEAHLREMGTAGISR
jgi:hypothetical protein